MCTMNHDNSNRENQTLVLALLRSQQLFMRAMGPVFRSEGLTAPQWDTLETLNNKGAMSINDLMRLTLSTSGNLDVVIKNLIQAGLVEKTIDESDQRGRVLCLTSLGHQKVANFLPIHNRALARIFADLNAQTKRETIKTLNRFRKTLPQSQKDQDDK